MDVQCYELFGGIALKNHAFVLFVQGCHLSETMALKNERIFIEMISLFN